jgi:hypothetical protein
MLKICENCKNEKIHHARGLCYPCYKKLHFKPKVKTCKRCKRKMSLHAKGLCPGCYNYVFHLDKNRAYRQRKTNNLDLTTFRKITEKCVLCDFNKIVDVYHLDKNKKNNDQSNLIGLCPNHHRLINNYNFRDEIYLELRKKGYFLPNLKTDEKLDFHKEN